MANLEARWRARSGQASRLMPEGPSYVSWRQELVLQLCSINGSCMWPTLYTIPRNRVEMVDGASEIDKTSVVSSRCIPIVTRIPGNTEGRVLVITDMDAMLIVVERSPVSRLTPSEMRQTGG